MDKEIKKMHKRAKWLGISAAAVIALLLTAIAVRSCGTDGEHGGAEEYHFPPGPAYTEMIDGGRR